MAECPQPLVQVALEQRGPKLFKVLKPIRCKRYTCVACGPQRRARIHKHLAFGADEARACRSRIRMVTLTYPSSRDVRADRPEDVAQVSEDWRRIVQRMRRRGVTFQYGRVLEVTKRGRIHIHAMTWGDFVPKCTNAGRRQRGLPSGPGSGSPCYCSEDRPCIQAAAWAEGAGFVDVTDVQDAHAASQYLAKYLVKQATRDWPRYARRYSYSGDFGGGETLGSIDAAHVARIRERMAAAGLVVSEVIEWGGLDPYPHTNPRQRQRRRQLLDAAKRLPGAGPLQGRPIPY